MIAFATFFAAAFFTTLPAATGAFNIEDAGKFGLSFFIAFNFYG
jgi:hypothetical protein